SEDLADKRKTQGGGSAGCEGSALNEVASGECDHGMDMHLSLGTRITFVSRAMLGDKHGHIQLKARGGVKGQRDMRIEGSPASSRRLLQGQTFHGARLGRSSH